MKIYIESDIVQLSKCNWSMSTIKDFSENFSVLMTIEINFRVLFEITSNDSIEIIPRIDSKTYDILHLSNQMHAWDGKNISFFICECSLFIESTYFNLASFSCVAWCTFTRESTDMVVALSIIQARIWLAFVVFIIAQFTGETWNEVKYSHKMKFKIHFECENCVFFFGSNLFQSIAGGTKHFFESNIHFCFSILPKKAKLSITKNVKKKHTIKMESNVLQYLWNIMSREHGPSNGRANMTMVDRLFQFFDNIFHHLFSILSMFVSRRTWMFDHIQFIQSTKRSHVLDWNRQSSGKTSCTFIQKYEKRWSNRNLYAPVGPATVQYSVSFTNSIPFARLNSNAISMNSFEYSSSLFVN